MRPLRLLAFAVFLISQTSVFAAEDKEYLAELIAKSKQLHLAERPEWLKLVHYVPNLVFPGVHGLVDSPDFYNAIDGKNSPQAELDGTLKSFFSDLEESDKQQNPQCLFIARYSWLNEQLKFNPSRLQPKECKRYQQWHAALNPGGLTLIFASAYINSPSSMYGHTLLRVDAKDQNEHTRLLAYAINFAANTDESNGLAFAFNGLFGGYSGTYSILPYYAKVREYSDMENRDVWEYELNLTSQELDRMLMHTWEMGSTYFRYFFFDENCAYNLLSLLQVARPELDLTSQFRWWAIPADTVKAVTAHNDLIKKVIYRPANATVLGYKLDLMSEHERDLTNALSTGLMDVNDSALNELAIDRKAAVLESSQDYVNYRRAKEPSDINASAVLSHELVSARGKLDVKPQMLDIPVPSVRPDQGHGSSRVGFGAGRKNGINFQEIQARATYHDIMDTDGGYSHGAQIEFFKLDVRHSQSGKSRIENFIPIDILSLTPRDEFFHPISWKVESGWHRVRIPNGSDPLAFTANGGIGGAWANDSRNTLWYTLLDASSLFNADFEKGYSLGIGANVGVMLDITANWRLHFYNRTMRYFSGQLDTAKFYVMEQRYALGRNIALHLDISRNVESGSTYNSGSAAIQFYF